MNQLTVSEISSGKFKVSYFMNAENTYYLRVTNNNGGVYDYMLYIETPLEVVIE